jgi:hypothetical protein
MLRWQRKVLTSECPTRSLTSWFNSGSTKWNTIPAVFVASFMFLGFLGVASQIEGPFGYVRSSLLGIPQTESLQDANDLDLDDICATLDRELKEITAHRLLEINSEGRADLGQLLLDLTTSSLFTRTSVRSTNTTTKGKLMRSLTSLLPCR